VQLILCVVRVLDLDGQISPHVLLALS
jgi:hypothetical protein